MEPQSPNQTTLENFLEEDVHIEKRELRINVQEIFSNLWNLDWSKVYWGNVVFLGFLHLCIPYGVYLALFSVQWKTLGFALMLFVMGGLGVTMGAHRLWAHRSFKATFPLRAVLVLFQTISLQQHIHEWTQNHRIHHKYSETDADPHNAKRGLFFSHIGWMMYEKHPEFTSKIQRMDMKDIENDCLVMWQKKHYLSLALLVSFIIPTLVPWLCWGEHLLNAVMVPAFLRCLVLYHITWSVNSLAHWTGGKPYEKNIYPSQNAVVAFLAMGEGWHNYHHVFPWDYKTSEFGGFTNINFTTLIIKLCSKVGLAYDLKTVTPEMIEKRARRTGDGTYKGPSK